MLRKSLYSRRLIHEKAKRKASSSIVRPGEVEKRREKKKKRHNGMRMKKRRKSQGGTNVRQVKRDGKRLKTQGRLKEAFVERENK